MTTASITNGNDTMTTSNDTTTTTTTTNSPDLSGLTKTEACLALLRSDDGAALNDYQVAERVGCSRGQAQRARLVWKAERAAARPYVEPDPPGESDGERMLRAILAADQGVADDPGGPGRPRR